MGHFPWRERGELGKSHDTAEESVGMSPSRRFVAYQVKTPPLLPTFFCLTCLICCRQWTTPLSLPGIGGRKGEKG